nr:hypothetical protein [Candidatus Woesebacteria bacterium]
MAAEKRTDAEIELARQVGEFRAGYMRELLPDVFGLAQDIAGSPSHYATHWGKFLESQAFGDRFDEGISAPVLQSLYGVATSRRNPYYLCEELQAHPLTPYYAHQASFFIKQDEAGNVIPRYRKLMIDGAPVSAVMHTHFDGPMLMNAILNLSRLEKDPKSIDLVRRAVPLMTAHDSIEDGNIPDGAGGLRAVTIDDVLLQAPDEIRDLIRIGVPLLTEPTYEELTDVPETFRGALKGMLSRFGEERARSLGMPEKQIELEEIYRKYGFEYGAFIIQVAGGFEKLMTRTDMGSVQIGEAVAMVEIADRCMDVSDLAEMYKKVKDPLVLEKALAHAASKSYMVGMIQGKLDRDAASGSPSILEKSAQVFHATLREQLRIIAQNSGLSEKVIQYRFDEMKQLLYGREGLWSMLPPKFEQDALG